MKLKRGVSLGEGMTYQLEEHTVGATIYLDTPGLEDINKREAAPRSINEALKNDGHR
jgi:hypothetical protein